MVLQTCAVCRVPPSIPVTPIEKKIAARTPKHRAETTVHGAAALSSEELLGYAVVRPKLGRTHQSITSLDDTITFVHVDGTPNLWLVEEVLKRAPNLKTIRVTPTQLRLMHPNSHLKLCKERGVRVITGHHRPEMAWDEGEQRTSSLYDVQRNFLLGLVGEQRILFEELLGMEFPDVQMVARYFCLQGEAYKPVRVLLEEYGISFSGGTAHLASIYIGAVLHYLDPAYQTTERNVIASGALKKRVARLRELLGVEKEKGAVRLRVAKMIGLDRLPERFPLGKVGLLVDLLKAQTDGRLASLRRHYPHAYQALSLRFDLEAEEPTIHRSLQEVGDLMNGISRQRVFQLEEEALKFLGLTSE